MGRLRKNILANLTGRAWGVTSVYIFIPLYLEFLGAEAYGLAGFYATLLAVLAFADLGLTATLSREMARLAVDNETSSKQRDLLRTYELAYACICMLLAFLTWLLAPFIAEYWLQSSTLEPREISLVIRLMGISVALQLPSNLYIGGLMGLQKQVAANVLQIAWSMLRGVGSVLVLWLLSPTILAFAVWQLICNAVYCVSVRSTLWHSLDPSINLPRFKWQIFRETWRYASGMAGLAVVSTLLMQSDKLIVSKMLPLETFGYYSIAVALAAVPRMLASPIAAASFPRFAGLAKCGDQENEIRLYRRTTALVAAAVVPGGLTLAIYAGDFIHAWTGNVSAAQLIGPVASCLLIGEVMQATMLVPYYLALAHGNIRAVLSVSIASVVLITPLLIMLIVRCGVLGAGLSWLVMNLCTLPIYMYSIHRKCLPGELRRWYLRSAILPVIVVSLCVLLCRLLIPHADSRMLLFGTIGLVWMVSLAAMATTVPELIPINRIRRVIGAPYGTK